MPIGKRLRNCCLRRENDMTDPKECSALDQDGVVAVYKAAAGEDRTTPPGEAPNLGPESV
jgi:hypothetical protein